LNTVSPISFSENQFNRLFPFYIRLNKKLQITAAGKSLQKLAPGCVQSFFQNNFSVKRPAIDLLTFQSLQQLEQQMAVVECQIENKPPVALRGQFEFVKDKNELLFLASPWFTTIEEVNEFNLAFHDFASHDPAIDFLHVLKTKEITNDDLLNLLSTINRQKNDLKAAAKKEEDVASLSMQNPDPLVRIAENGHVIMMNPAAEKIKEYTYNGKVLTPDKFWKKFITTKRKDVTGSVSEVEAGGHIYSFISRYVKKDGYYNIYGREITAQKRNSDELSRLSLVASANENGIVFTYPNGKIFWANEGFLKLTRYQNHEVFGKTPVELCKGPLTDKEQIKKMITAFEKGKSFNIEAMHYRKNGTWFWGRSKGQSVKDEKGNVVQYFAMVEDITEEKAKEEKLRILSQIAEDNINAVIITNEDGKIAWVNKSFTKMTGYSLEEAWGQKPGHLLQGPDTDEGAVAYLSAQIKKGRPFNTELLNYSKDGRAYWLRIQGQPFFDKEGKLTGFFALEEDITREKEINEQIKQTELRFRLALEKIGDNVWEHDFRTGETVFSMTEDQLLGYSGNEFESIAELWWHCIDEKDKHFLEENDKAYKSGKKDQHSLEYRMRNKNGDTVWILDRGVVIEKDSEGLPLRIIGTHTNITNQKKLELDLIESRENAKLLAKTKETFLANMSHEMRTPMNAILGMSTQLAKTPLNDKQKFFLEAIHTSADNLLVIINDILDLSKIEAGKLTLEKIGFEPRHVVTKALQLFTHKAEEKGLRLTNSLCDARLSPVLLGDPYRINQILLNLLSNAIKFTDKGSVDIRCEVIEETNLLQVIQVSVVDTGAGMDEKFLGSLFDKFTQEYESVSRKFGGSGLGMSICKELIEMMGGEINVVSEKGKGTCVTFKVVLEKGNNNDLPVKEEIQIDNTIFKSKTILITDDNEMNRVVAQTVLENYSANILHAVNGKDAVEMLQKHKIDIVLMDIQMPEMNGYEATQFIRNNLKLSLPVIALTANALKGENQKCLNAGMNDYISKPFKEEDLIRTLGKWLKTEVNMQSKPVVKAAPVEGEIETNVNTGPAKLYDVKSLEQISNGNTGFINKMVVLFCEQTPEIVQQMMQAYNKKELEVMGALAHKMKPSIDNLNIDGLKDVIRAVEKAGKEGDGSEHVNTMLQKVNTTVTAAVNKMKQDFNL
jgi:PAS domain S-box-containing protein